MSSPFWLEMLMKCGNSRSMPGASVLLPRLVTPLFPKSLSLLSPFSVLPTWNSALRDEESMWDLSAMSVACHFFGLKSKNFSEYQCFHFPFSLKSSNVSREVHTFVFLPSLKGKAFSLLWCLLEKVLIHFRNKLSAAVCKVARKCDS